MRSPLDRHTRIYIVRVWAEYLKEQPPCWRGVVEFVDQGKTISFGDLSEMTQLIQQNANVDCNAEGKK